MQGYPTFFIHIFIFSVPMILWGQLPCSQRGQPTKDLASLYTKYPATCTQWVWPIVHRVTSPLVYRGFSPMVYRGFSPMVYRWVAPLAHLGEDQLVQRGVSPYMQRGIGPPNHLYTDGLSHLPTPKIHSTEPISTGSDSSKQISTGYQTP
jgi:hypothetical protein